MVTAWIANESYELEDAAATRSSEFRGKYETSSKARFNTRARYARSGKGGPTLSGAHRRRAKKSYV